MGSFDKADGDACQPAVGDRFVRLGGIAFAHLHAFDEAFEGSGDVERGVEDGFVGRDFFLGDLAVSGNEMGEHGKGSDVD